MERGEGITAIVIGMIIAVAGYVLGNVITFGGVTFAAFNFGIVLGVALMIFGVVTTVRGR
jgi:hypothetical protein